MQQTPHASRRAWSRRATSLLLALVMILGLVPGLPAMESEASAHWADPYLSQLVEWGFIRADQAENPNRALTRADFMAITNRAYGYHETGETPFVDVAENDWFYDDVGIAYTAKYIKGTSPTTASPNNPLTRETAATILGRNMMLQESPGELLDFTDARQISNWARGTVKSSLEHYLVSGYDDGTFRPQRNVSWGEMAAMLSNLVGTPLQEPGDYSLGGVFGNVTITSPGVTLRDTVISGDLYISGGVGLGDVKLENVTVLGRIIASGTGRSESGAASILLRNVTADELLIDNLQGNLVSVQADGVTDIGRTTVRTNAYIEDNTPDGMGLKYISIEGETYPEGEEPEDWEPIQVDLAGRIEEVVNRTPGSQVRAARGTVAKLTVDEAAVDSTVIIDRGAVVKELNLDTGTIVTGEGDIGHLVVNAPGCEVEMLPDKIDIRPGITAIIAGEEMDTVAAEESSMDPMILAGYPQARDIIPTGLDAVFSTNKAGTVYWAVSAITDGSIGEEDLIKPPSYGNLAVRNGSLKIARGNEETTAKITGLTPGGSYYLSAVLVDARDKRSATKVISFTTPDNTTPAFCAGYPHMSKVSRTDSVVVVMPNKDCKLYYALLPQGAAAPTENELKTSSVSGALGYGVRDVTKNVEDAFRVNDVILEEQTTYVLYLWLTDADGVNKSAITSLTFTTDDETPPEFIVPPYQERTTANSVTMKFQLNENGTVYWVAFPSGTIDYPLPQPGTEDKTAPWNSEYAILQVVNAMNIGADGKSGRVNARAMTDGTFNITGLKPETSYDVYYVAKDNAGPDRNYSVTIGKVVITPQDGNPPIVKQSFSNPSNPNDKTTNPRATTAIYLDISENVRYNNGRSFAELGEDAANLTGEAQTRAINQLAAALYDSIKLYQVNPETRAGEEVASITNTNQLISAPFDEQPDVTIDYTQATVEYYPRGSQSIRITFPTTALHLENGGQYYFSIKGLSDTSNNRMQPDDEYGVDFWNNKDNSTEAGHEVPVFVVEFAGVLFTEPVMNTVPTDPNTGEEVRMTRSVNFRMTPISTGTVDDIYSYDIVIWNSKRIAYDLYYRVVDKNGRDIFKDGEYPANAGTAETPITDYLLHNPNAVNNIGVIDENGWIYLGNSTEVMPTSDQRSGWRGRSVSQFFNDCDAATFSKLNKLSEDLRYDFVMTITYFDGESDPSAWDGPAYFYVNVAAGQPTNLINLPMRPSTSDWDRLEAGGILGGLQSIGQWNDATSDPDTLVIYRELSPTGLPSFVSPTPTLTPGSTSVSVDLGLSADGLIHYAVSELEEGVPKITTVRAVMQSDLKEDGSGDLKDNVDEYESSKYTGSLLGAFGSVLDPQNRLMHVTVDSPDPPREGGTSTLRPILPWMKGGGPTESTERDNPMGDNLLVEPTNSRVVSKDWEASEAVAAGEFKPTQGVREPLLINEGLKPDTDYFIYFVITLPEDLETKSHVYVYHFKTLEASKPKTDIKLPGRGDSGDVDMGVDDANATANWRVYSLSDATNGNISILRKPFALFTAHPGVDADGNSYIDSTGAFNLDDYKKAEGSDKTPYIYLQNNDGTPFTVLDALTTSYSYSLAHSGYSQAQAETFYFPQKGTSYTAYDRGYTVFDMYANDDAREYLYQLVVDGQMGNPESVSDNVIAGPTGKEDMKKAYLDDSFYYNLEEISKLPIMSGGNSSSRFLFLMAAENPSMITDEDQSHSTIASFRASPFQKDSLVPPNVRSASGGIVKDALSGTYSGRVTINFELDTFLARDGGNSTAMTRENLYDGRYPLTMPQTGEMTPNTVSPRSFTLDINSVPAGPNSTLTFPANYFANLSNISAEEELDIMISSESDGVYLIVMWGGKEIYRSKAQEASSTYVLSFEKGVQGDLSNPHLVLDMGSTPTASVTASITPKNLSNLQYMWTVATGSDVVSVAPEGWSNADADSTHTATVTAIRPGKATINASGMGSTANNGLGNASNSFPVTVTGSVDPFTAGNVTTNNATFSGSQLTLTLGTTSEAVFTVTANSQSLASGTRVSCSPNYANKVTCDISGNKIAIRPGRNATASDGPYNLTIGLVADDGTNLTPNGTQTITVSFVDPTSTTATYSIRETPAKKPTLTLLSSNVTLDMGGTKTATVKANVSPSGTAVSWKSDNTSVANVSGGVITAKGIGTTVVTATIPWGDDKVEERVSVTVKGSVTGLTLKSSESASWSANSNELTFTKGPKLSPSAKFSVTTNGPISNTAVVRCAVTDSKQKDYVTCTVGTDNTITVTPGKSTPASTETISLTVDLVTKDGSVVLSSKKMAFKVKVTGNDSGANIAKP